MNIDIKNSMPPNTEKLFKKFSEFRDIKEWTLVGGTALSIHIKHRTSEYLDFFINKNKINSSLKIKIDKMLENLREEGYLINQLDSEDNEYQLDFNISGIKVTFCITSGIDLKADISTYNNIDLASKDAIAAMKMYTLLKHRIKSRDFYDIKYLIEDIGYKFEDLIDLLKVKFPRYNPSRSYINNRFTKTKLNYDDEGFDSLELKKQEDFNSLRKYFKKLINTKIEEETEILSKIIEGDEELLISKINNNFDLSNDSLAMKLIQLRQFNKYERLLKTGLFNPEKYNIEGKMIFDYLAEVNQVDLFNDTLNLLDYIPDGLSQRLNNFHEYSVFIQLIKKHQLLNRLLKKDEVSIDKILDNLELNKEEYKSLLSVKKQTLNSLKSNNI